VNTELSFLVAGRISAAIVRCDAICYGVGIADKEYPEITWERFGLISTNEIAAIARVGALCFGIVAPSRLMYPAMVERIFGMDVWDDQLSRELSGQLWTQLGEQLTAEVMRLRRGS
jgi:hypothetical protein